MTDPSRDSASKAGGSEQPLAERAAERADRLWSDERADRVLDTLAREHPELADRLHELFPTINLMADLRREFGGPARSEDQRAAAGEAAPAALGDFRILRELGRGGMGVVYAAQQVSLNRLVALKILPEHAMRDPRRIERFQVEARALAALDHPGIVPVHAVGHDGGTPYLVMKLIVGPTLADVVKRLKTLRNDDRDETTEVDESTPGRPVDEAAGPSTWTGAGSPGRLTHRAVAELGLQAAEALSYAHDLGIVHRDVKPANLMLEASGRLWITDFGTARIESESDLTRTGDLIGTLRYMSPEQASGRRGSIDERTDVYSLGATLYELLTLRPPFAAEDRLELLRMIAHDPLPPPRAADGSIPVDLETLVLKAMAKDPAGRYASARAFAADLRRFLAGEPVRARPEGRIDRLRSWCLRPERVPEAGSALVTLGALMIGIGAIVYIGFLMGLIVPKDRNDFQSDFLLALVVFDAPPLWCGVKTLAGKRSGLRLGLVATLNFLVWLILSLMGWNILDYGGAFTDKTAETPFVLLLLLLVGHTVVRTSLGIAADQANRRGRRDSEKPTSLPPCL